MRAKRVPVDHPCLAFASVGKCRFGGARESTRPIETKKPLGSRAAERFSWDSNGNSLLGLLGFRSSFVGLGGSFAGCIDGLALRRRSSTFFGKVGGGAHFALRGCLTGFFFVAGLAARRAGFFFRSARAGDKATYGEDQNEFFHVVGC